MQANGTIFFNSGADATGDGAAALANETFCPDTSSHDIDDNGPIAKNVQGVYPNLLYAALLRGNNLMVPNVGAQPEPPVKFNVNIQPLVSVVDLSNNTQISTNLNNQIKTEAQPVNIEGNLERVFGSDIVAMDAIADGKSLLIVSRGGNYIMRAALADDGGVSIDAPNNVVSIQAGNMPSGIIMSNDGARAYTNDANLTVAGSQIRSVHNVGVVTTFLDDIGTHDTTKALEIRGVGAIGGGTIDKVGDTLTFSISGGADQNAFSIDSVSGALTLTNAADFEAPSDANADGLFEVTLNVDDGNSANDQLVLALTVEDVTQLAVNVSYPTPNANLGGDVAFTSITGFIEDLEDGEVLESDIDFVSVNSQGADIELPTVQDNVVRWRTQLPLTAIPDGTLDIALLDRSNNSQQISQVLLFNPFSLANPEAIALDSANNRALVVDDSLDALVAIDLNSGERAVSSR